MKFQKKASQQDDIFSSFTHIMHGVGWELGLTRIAFINMKKGQRSWKDMCRSVINEG